MIIGNQQNVLCIDLLPTENADILVNKYNKSLSNLNVDYGLLFFVDIWGGTPFNAAQRIILEQKNYDIITGMNIPMLIEVFIARDNVNSIKELVQIALQSGSESIKSVKNMELSNHVVNKSLHKLTTVQKNNITSKISNDISNKQKKYMTICLARIDDRLIHGQVVTRWAKEYDINRIIVVNDDVAQDKIRKTLLTQVTPPGITAHVINIQKAIRVYNNPKYSKDKVIMLFTNPTDIVRLVESDIPILSVNIGGMSFSQGKKQINNFISVNSIDIEAFKKLDQLGIELEIRKVPSDSSIKLMKLITHMKN